MENTSKLQEQLFGEMKNKSVFNKAINHAFVYVDNALERNVYPNDEALTNLTAFEEKMPLKKGNADEVIDLLNEKGSPATVIQLGGRYYGFVNGSSLPVGLAAKTLATYWDQNTAMHVLSPVSAKLESVCERWLVELLGLPERTVAGFVSGTSSANFCGLAAARYRMLKRQGWDVGEQGIFNAPSVRIVTGKHAHSTVIKALALLGFGKQNIEWVDVDDQGRILVDKMPALDDKTIVVLQAGNVNSGSFDHFRAISERAQAAGAWVHIDGAFGLFAAAAEKLKHLTDGIELANSWAVDGHKTLNTPYDSGIVLCEDKEAIISALHMTGGYIVVSENQRDGMFYTPDMSRRARVIELWATLKYLGREGINEMVYTLHVRAKQFAAALKEVEGFEVLNDVVFNQVLVCCNNDELTDRTIHHIQQIRTCWVGGSTWFGKKVIRISVSSWATTADDVRKSVQSFIEAHRRAVNDLQAKHTNIL